MLSSAPLGLNTAPWDYFYAANTSAGGGADIIQPPLKAASIDMLRYGGGSYADYRATSIAQSGTSQRPRLRNQGRCPIAAGG